MCSLLHDNARTAQAPSSARIAQVPDIAPEYVVFQGGFRDSPEWGSAAVLIPSWLASWYGTLAPVKQSFATAQNYVDYLLSRRNATTGLLDYGLGDWESLTPTPLGVTATAILVQDLQAMTSMAERLGLESAASNYSRLAAAVANAYTDNFWNGSAYPTQTAAGMALTLNITPTASIQQVRAALVADVVARGNVTTGADIGNRYIIQALAEAEGGTDALWSSLLRTTSPGYGFAVASNETALPETWDDSASDSHIHAMLGHIDEYFYSHVAGLRQAVDDVGWRRILIRPRPTVGLAWLNCSFEAPSGQIAIFWELRVPQIVAPNKGGADQWDFELYVTIPVGSTAGVTLPIEDVGTVEVVGTGRPRLLRASGRLLK
jgi:hypothetical protein